MVGYLRVTERGSSKKSAGSLWERLGDGWYLLEQLSWGKVSAVVGRVGVDFIVKGHGMFEIRAERARWEMEIWEGWGLLPIIDL